MKKKKKRISSKSNSPASLLAQSKAKRIGKNRLHEAAVELGRLGGNAGGYARADALSSERRSEIAAYAANVRWAGGNGKKLPKANA